MARILLLLAIVACSVEPEEAANRAPSPDQESSSLAGLEQAVESTSRASEQDELDPALSSPEVYGRVLDARSREPVAGVTVTFHGDERHRVVTAEDGSFRWRASGEFPRVYVSGGRHGSWLRPGESSPYAASIPAKAVRGEEPLELFVVKRSAGTLDGIAVDMDGEPLMGIEFTLTSNRVLHRIRTGTGGRFEVAEFACGPTHVRSTDAKPEFSRVELASGLPEPMVLRFHRSSVIHVELHGVVPAKEAAMEVRLYPADSSRALASGELVLEHGTTGRAHLIGSQSEHEAYNLVVRDLEGVSYGTTEIGREARSSGEVIPVSLRAVGAVELDPPLGLRYREKFTRLFDSEGREQHEMKWLDPGSYRLIYQEPGVEEWRGPVEIRGGETTRVVVPREEEATRNVTVSFVDETGEGFDETFLRLSVVGKEWNYRTCDIIKSGVYHHGGCWLIGSDLEPGEPHITHWQVPVGQLQLRERLPDRCRPFRVETQGLPTGDQNLTVTFFRIDQGFGFRLAENEDGDESGGSLTVGIRVTDGGASPISTRTAHGLIGHGDPRKRRFEWSVHSRQYGTTFGDQDDFVEEAPGHWYVVLPREKQTYHVRTIHTDTEGRPVEGVEVFRMERSLGKSDVGGVVTVAGLSSGGLRAVAPGYQVKERRWEPGFLFFTWERDASK